jgi:hypothetical protein
VVQEGLQLGQLQLVEILAGWRMRSGSGRTVVGTITMRGKPGWLEDAEWFRKDCSWDNYNEGKAWLVAGRTVGLKRLQFGQLQ